MELVYDGNCNKCSIYKNIIKTVDIDNKITYTTLQQRQKTIEKIHSGYIHSPHLFLYGYVFYGLRWVTPLILFLLPFIFVWGLISICLRQLK